jgi:hypothetical protein
VVVWELVVQITQDGEELESMTDGDIVVLGRRRRYLYTRPNCHGSTTIRICCTIRNHVLLENSETVMSV